MGESGAPAKRKLFDRTAAILLVLGTAGGVACYIKGGSALLGDVLVHQAHLLVEIAPLIAAGLLIAGFVQALLPRDAIRRWLGGSAGWRSILIGSAAGMITPGGPFVSFPLVYVLHKAGADIGTLVAYVTAWSVIGVHRLLIWEFAFLGPEYALIRFAASLPLPLVAGFLARRVALRFLATQRPQP